MKKKLEQPNYKPELREKWLYRSYLVVLREKAGIRIDMLAERLFLDKNVYYRMEDGERGHRMNALFYIRLAKELKTSIEEIINLEAEYQKERIKMGLMKEPWYMTEEGDDDEN